MNTAPALAQQIIKVARLKGAFRLRSGVTSSEYFDKYRFEADPVLLRAIAGALAARLPGGNEALAGLEMGGIPIAAMLSQLTGLPTLFIRKKAKEYGTCRFAEGGEVRGRRLLLVEDVVTSGGAVIDAVRALRGEGAVVSDVVCVIDRQSGGEENLRKEGLSLVSLFSKAYLESACQTVPPAA
jgi:orotate phosphoribosyltransferase